MRVLKFLRKFRATGSLVVPMSCEPPSCKLPNSKAVACFFETPWSRVSPALTESGQAWLLNEAASTVRALGRLTEALEPMRAGLAMCVKQENGLEAAKHASNLSELELTLGEVAGAVEDAEQSVTYADRSGDAFIRMITRTTYADALHQAGRRAEAEGRFREAETLPAESQPSYPLLYSVQGFQYCDLLLTEAERVAWQLVVAARGATWTKPGKSPSAAPCRCSWRIFTSTAPGCLGGAGE